MAEMAINEVANFPKQQQPKILSHYLSHGVYRGIKRHKILMANSDQMVKQGMMAIDQAIDYLEGNEIKLEQGPVILTIDQSTVGDFDINKSLSPSDFNPQYRVLSPLH